MKTILFIITFCMALFSSTTALAAPGFTLTESQLNQGLRQQLGKEFPLGLGQWLSATMQVQDIAVELGRQEADKARVQGQALLNVTQGQQRYQWNINADFNARPRYDNEQGALFLDEFELLNYQVNKDSSSMPASFMLPIILQALTKYLSQYPVYTLDEQDPLQRQLKDQVVSLDISPGKIALYGLE